MNFNTYNSGGGPFQNAPFQQQQQQPAPAVPGQPRMFAPNAAQQTNMAPPPQPPGVGFNPAMAAAPSSMPPQQQPSAAFYGQQQQQPGMMKPPGSDPTMSPMPPQQPGMMQQQQPGMMPGMPGMAPPAPVEIFQENIDYSIQVPKRILRLTAGHIPSSMNLGHQCKVPMGAIIRPLAPEGPGDEGDVQVVQPGAAGIVRCKR